MSSPTIPRPAMRFPGAIVVATLVGVAPAQADDLGLEARGGLGLSGMISTAQRDQGFKSGFVPDLRPALRLGDMLAAELAVAGWAFPRDAGTGRATMVGAGLRCDPRLTGWLSWFVDGHAGLGLTGDANRFMADAGTGFEIWFSDALAIGPYVRYGHVVDSGGPDPRFWGAGLLATVAWRSGEDEPPALGPVDRDREERQREWQRSRERELQGPRYRDRDRDGVVDEDDICPDERPGSNPDPNLRGCPRSGGPSSPPPVASTGGDRDGDGVPDRDDRCPDRSFGQTPDPMSMGCPLPDRDRDGIPDIADACPTRAGVADSREKANGCPGLARIERGMIQLSRPILFSGSGDGIQSGSTAVLQAVADVLKATPAIKKVSIEGHTDGSSASQGFDLSERRAESVRRWLVDNGVESYRLGSRGFGDTRPVASNRTAKGRAANARVELVIVDPANGEGLP